VLEEYERGNGTDEKGMSWCAENVLASDPHALQFHHIVALIFFAGQNEARKDVVGGAEVYLTHFRTRCEGMAL